MANLTNLLKGEQGDYAVSETFDPTELAIGVQIEMEHTNDIKIAKEIALDHLKNDPEYYTKLAKAGLTTEFQPMPNSGYGDPDAGFNDVSRTGNKEINNTNMGGSISNTPNGEVSGRRSIPVHNKTLDIELQEKKKAKKKKPKPTKPSLWSRAKSMAKSKFDVYPSAYANAWAAKWYKKKGGGWRMSESCCKSNNDCGCKNKNKKEQFDSTVSSMPKDSGTYGSGYDFVGPAENNTKMKEELTEQVGMYQVIKFKLGESTYEIISVDNFKTNNIQRIIDNISNKDSYNVIQKTLLL